MKALGQGLQLFDQHLGQARQAAQAQLLADLCREQLALLAQARLPAFQQQVADVQQLQQPGVRHRLHPATQVQGRAVEAVEIQVQELALPIGGSALDGEAAMGQEKIQQVRQLCRGDLLG
ncbi:hypothetical protein D3C72_1853100 [compost metagenome]